MKIIKYLSTAVFSIVFSSVVSAQCVANATVTPTSTPGVVHIVDLSTGISPYSWITFYDANNASVGSTYLQPYSTSANFQLYQNGLYTYVVNVIDSLSNCNNSVSGTILISGITPQASCNAQFYSSNQNTLSYLNFYFTNYSGNNSSTAEYNWNFGDGNTGTGINPSHTYNANGNYIVCLTVSDTALNGCSATYCDTINVTPTPQICNAAFYSYDSTINTLEMYFGPLWNNSATATYTWSFGDGTSSNLQYPTHTYATAGNYTVCLIVSDTANGGCSNTSCNVVSAGGAVLPNCNAYFYLWQDSTNVGQYYAYNYSNANALSYFWDFGDGNSSTSAYPSHIYQNAGTYVICLTVIDSAFGTTCTSQYCDTLIVVLKATGVQLNVLQPGQFATVENLNGVVNTHVYPNPTEGNYSIEIEANHQSEITVSVTNLVGQVIETSIQSISVGKNTLRFDAESYTSGIYIISIKNNKSGETFNTKLIKN